MVALLAHAAPGREFIVKSKLLLLISIMVKKKNNSQSLCSHANVHVAPCSHHQEPVFVNASHIYIPPGWRSDDRDINHCAASTCRDADPLIGFMSGAQRRQKTALHAVRTADHSSDNLCDVLTVGERGEDLTNENTLLPRALHSDKALRSQEIR